MTVGLALSNCPTEETLAAFIDGRLDEGARARVVEHLADCAECRDVVLMADELATAGVIASADKVVRGRFRSRVMPAAILAAAAVLVVLFLIPVGDGTGMADLADAAETIKLRPTDARLNADLDDYKPVRPRYRGVGGNKPLDWNYEVESINVRLQNRREKSPRDLHVLGVSHLLLGRADEAIEALEAAVKLATGTSDVRRAVAASRDVALLTDLVNAYLARNGKPDQIAAAQIAQRAWTLEQTPLTAWNRALTMEGWNPRAAPKAWDDYLRRDRKSRWAGEALGRKERLVTGTSP